MSEGLTLLAVDDELPALHDLTRMLRSSPAVAHVDASASGEDALGKLARRSYDGVFLDVRMPGVDGLELAGVVFDVAGRARNVGVAVAAGRVIPAEPSSA